MSDSAPPPPPPPPPGSPYGQMPGPYGAAAGGRPAGVLPRFAARLLDGIIVVVVAGVIGVILNIALDGYVLRALDAVIGATLYLGYFVYLETTWGQTLGKMALGLRVVGPDGTSRPTTEQSMRRNVWTAFSLLGVLGAAGSTLGALLGLGSAIAIAITISTDTVGRRSVFDKVAGGTQVLTRG